MRGRLALKILLGNAITVVAAIVLYVIVALAMQTEVDGAALGLFAGALAIVALAASFVYSRVITKNIETLYESATSISRGDLSKLVQFEVPSRVPDEVDHLAGAINQMLENLRELVS